MPQPNLTGLDANGGLHTGLPTDFGVPLRKIFMVNFAQLAAPTNVKLGPVFPNGTVITNALLEVITAFTDDGTGTAKIGIGLNTSVDVLAAAAVSGAPFSTTGTKACLPVGSAATAVAKLTTGDTQLTFDRDDTATKIMVGGLMQVIVDFYVVPV